MICKMVRSTSLRNTATVPAIAKGPAGGAACGLALGIMLGAFAISGCHANTVAAASDPNSPNPAAANIAPVDTPATSGPTQVDGYAQQAEPAQRAYRGPAPIVRRSPPDSGIPNESQNYQNQIPPNQNDPAQGYQNQPAQNQIAQNQGYQNPDYGNQGYQNQGYQNPDYGNQGYQNQGYQNQGYNGDQNDDQDDQGEDGYNPTPGYQDAYQPPPPLPVYEQPEAPYPNSIWTPGYWGYSPQGYFWVPGAWVQAPYTGALWTPGYWGFLGNLFRFHSGFWAPHIGFYGGIDYGFGYGGTGYQGGYWNGDNFFYNRACNRINTAMIGNVYQRNVVIDNTTLNNTVINRVSYNGGTGGIQLRPRPAEIAVLHEPRIPPMRAQMLHQQQAAQNPRQLYAENHGRPVIVAAVHPLAADRGIVAPMHTTAQIDRSAPVQEQLRQQQQQFRAAPSIRPVVAPALRQGTPTPTAAEPQRPFQQVNPAPQTRPFAQPIRPSQPAEQPRPATRQQQFRPQPQPQQQFRPQPQPQPQQQFRPQPQPQQQFRPQPPPPSRPRPSSEPKPHAHT